MTRFEEFLARKRAAFGERFDPSDLAPQFVEAFNNAPNWRVKVPHLSGEQGRTQWGHVGITSGWRPSFLLMRSRSAHGSSYVLRADTPILSTAKKP